MRVLEDQITIGKRDRKPRNKPARPARFGCGAEQALPGCGSIRKAITEIISEALFA
jgi:hypothetical protein